MVIERILIVLILAAVGSGAYTAIKSFHRKRLGRVTGVNKPLLLYFRSENCAPCMTQARYLDQLAQTWSENLTIEKIDADVEPEKARHYGVFTLPTTILVDSFGNVRQVNYGLTNAQKLSQQLNAM